MHIDPIELTRKLINLDTVNPPGSELAAAELLEGLLGKAGFEIDCLPLDDGRCSLIAHWPGDGTGKVRCFTGHLDTVPLGTRAWTFDAFAGDIRDGRIRGRGAADMKGGVAAIVSAAIAASARRCRHPIKLILTAGEETGCDGARHIAAHRRLGPAAFLLVAEPTSNRVCCGHKGVLWLKIAWRGRAAHGSMPELGDNAVLKAIRTIKAIDDLQILKEEHPLLGRGSVSIGYLSGVANINIVPDRAEAGIDIRTVPSQSQTEILAQIASLAGANAVVEDVLRLDSVVSDPSDPRIAEIQHIAVRVTDQTSAILALPYFTDAAVLAPALETKSIAIVGPGDPRQAHQTDESCSAREILDATEIYKGCMLADFRAGNTSAMETVTAEDHGR